MRKEPLIDSGFINGGTSGGSAQSTAALLDGVDIVYERNPMCMEILTRVSCAIGIGFMITIVVSLVQCVSGYSDHCKNKDTNQTNTTTVEPDLVTDTMETPVVGETDD